MINLKRRDLEDLKISPLVKNNCKIEKLKFKINKFKIDLSCSLKNNNYVTFQIYLIANFSKEIKVILSIVCIFTDGASEEKHFRQISGIQV
jgi:hypothetical protein